jgi:hypothetical protein
MLRTCIRIRVFNFIFVVRCEWIIVLIFVSVVQHIRMTYV